MKHYLNPKKAAKSFVLAGALSFGVFAGGHFTEAAGPDHGKANQAAQVKAEVKVKVSVPAVKVQAKDEVKVKVKDDKGKYTGSRYAHGEHFHRV